MRPRLLLAASLLTVVFSGCATAPHGGAGPIPETARFATIVGSEEKSMLLDNFTAFAEAIDGRPVTGGRSNWDKQVAIRAGRCKLTARFIRGVFQAGADLEFEAKADTSYQLRFKTDAQLFGQNSFCDFWIVDLAAGQPVTAVVRAAMVKIN